MGGTGVEMRMKLLRDAADQQLMKPLRSHGWAASVTQENPVGEYLIVEGAKSGITRRVALLYSSATDNKHYKVLDATVDSSSRTAPSISSISSLTAFAQALHP